MSAPAPRTLADQLRGWSPEDVVALLDARPDLAVPAPQDSAQLAARAVVPRSVARALDGLDALELGVLEALLYVGPAGEKELSTVVNADPARLALALATLRRRALAWGAEDALRAVSPVGDLLGVPAGPADPDAALDEVDELARAILDHLDRTGADGAVAGIPARLTPASASSPTEALLARRLLVPRDDRRVTLPWTVRLTLRGGTATRDDVGRPPPLATATRDQALVDRTAGGTAFELIRRVELLLDRWGTEPPGVLRTGGLGVRDLRTVGSLLQVSPAEAALVVEVALAAGLVGQGMTDDADAAWLPTDGFDAWQAQPPAERWTTLARAWLRSPRLAAAVGGRTGDRPVNALSAELERPWLPGVRRETLTTLSTAIPGAVLAAGTGVPSLVAALRWHRPRRPEPHFQAVADVLAEAAMIGVTALDGLSGAGRVLLDDASSDADVAAAVGAHLPASVDHVLLQADLTAVAPGPLEGEPARTLALLTDVESGGGATVHRFGRDSVRRAFDAGWSAAEVHDFVADISRTPVPQALTFLIDDVARRFGTLRVGQVETFLRSDDQTALTELVHDPAAASLRLRRIAPTVVVTDVPLGVVLPRLRELGSAPVVEAPDGTVRVARPDVFRARTPRRPSGARGEARAAASHQRIATAVRAGDRAASAAPRDRAATSPGEVMTLLRNAATASDPVLIGYVGNDGSASERVVVPHRLEGGRLTAYDERADDVRTFAVHRITAASPAPRD